MAAQRAAVAHTARGVGQYRTGTSGTEVPVHFFKTALFALVPNIYVSALIEVEGGGVGKRKYWNAKKKSRYKSRVIFFPCQRRGRNFYFWLTFVLSVGSEGVAGVGPGPERQWGQSRESTFR